MENVIGSQRLEGANKEQNERCLPFLILLEELRRHRIGNQRVPWAYSWEGPVLQINPDSLNPSRTLEDQWFALGELLEEMDIRAAGAGVELDVVINEEGPGARIRPTRCVPKGHPLSFGLPGHGRFWNDGQDTISPEKRWVLRAVVEEPGANLVLIDHPLDVFPSEKNQFLGAMALGFIVAEGKTPSFLMLAGRSFERFQLMAQMQGFRIDVLEEVGQLARRSWVGGLAGLDFARDEKLDLEADALAQKEPALERSFATVAFCIKKGPSLPAASFEGPPVPGTGQGIKGAGQIIANVFHLGRSRGPVPDQAPLKSIPRAGSPTVAEPVSFDYDAAFSRNMGLVQPEEQRRLRESVVAVAGLGGVGGVHVTTLARMGIGRFHLADFDRFEIHNFNRQTGATVGTLGREKIEVMAEQARSINPSVEVRPFPQGVTAENVDAFLDGVDVVVDGLDFFVPEAREILYDAAERRGIPLVTAGPIGMSVAWLIFVPGGMRWRDYFRFDRAKTPVDKLILFALGLTPKATQMSYIDRRYVDLPGHRGPSLALAVQLCAGVAAGEALKLILGRGRVASAPTFHQFDVYRGRYVTGKLRWGNAGLLQRLKFLIARRWIVRPSHVVNS